MAGDLFWIRMAAQFTSGARGMLAGDCFLRGELLSVLLSPYFRRR
jgi:hypothetical protein